MTFEGIELIDEFVPHHVAIIMDGNGRWAKAHKKSRAEGHRAGSERVIAISEAACEIGVKVITAYAFSTENWNRSEEEVNDLMRLLEEFFKRDIHRLMKDGIRVKQIGDPSRLPKRTRAVVEDAEERSKGNTRMLINVALNYGARDEIQRMAQKIARDALSGTLSPEAIDERAIAARLDTAHTNDPDLLIRTSGEMRLSNFLLYQIAYSELWFTDTLWPEFTKKEFAKAIYDYQQRERRFGGRRG